MTHSVSFGSSVSHHSHRHHIKHPVQKEQDVDGLDSGAAAMHPYSVLKDLHDHYDSSIAYPVSADTEMPKKESGGDTVAFSGHKEKKEAVKPEEATEKSGETSVTERLREKEHLEPESALIADGGLDSSQIV